jgi:hypothetical protein
MDDEPERVFFRNRLSRENGDFQFFCLRCPNAGLMPRVVCSQSVQVGQIPRIGLDRI